MLKKADWNRKRNGYRARWTAFGALVGAALFVSSCGRVAQGTAATQPPSTQEGVVASKEGTDCRVPQNLIPTFSGTYSGSLSVNGTNQAASVVFSPLTLPGYSGTFMKGVFTISPPANATSAQGIQSFETTFCTTAVMNSNQTAAGAYFFSNPVESNGQALDYINSSVPFRVFAQIGLTGGTQFNPANSGMKFYSCSLVHQNCSTQTEIPDVVLSGMSKQ